MDLPVFKVILRSKQQREVDLFDYLALIVADDVLTVVNMQPHQRPPMVEAPAVLINLVNRFSKKPAKTAADFQKALSAVPLALVPVDEEAGFLQPYLPKASFDDRISFEVLGATPNAAKHALKDTLVADPFLATIFLIAGLRSTYGGRGHYGALRRKIPSVLVSSDGSFSSEVLHLSKLLPSKVRGETIGDHLGWATPWTGTVLGDDSPQPVIDCCAVRLRNVDGGIAAYWTGTDTARMTAVWLGDPHTARIRNGGPYTMSKMRKWTPVTKHAVMFGSEDAGVDPATILTDVGNKGVVVRVSASFYPEDSALKEFFESVYFSRGGHPRQRTTQLSTLALTAVKEAERALRAALLTLYSEKIPRPGQSAAQAMPHTQARVHELAAQLGEQTIPLICRFLADIDPDATSDPSFRKDEALKALNELAEAEVLKIWGPASRSAPVFVAARASLRLDQQIEDRLHTRKGATMAHVDTKAVWETLAKLDGLLEFRDEDRKAIRSAGKATDHAWAAIKLLAALPNTATQTHYQESVWLLAIRGLAHFRHGGDSAGRVLGDSGFHEMRMERIVHAPNSALLALIEEAIDFLADERTHINLTDLIALALAPEGSSERRDIGLKIAKDFVRGGWADAPEKTGQAA